MADHARITGAPTCAPAFQHLRRCLSAEIETHLARVDSLIARLDRLDSDCDLEDDDPAGDVLDEHGEAPSNDGTRILPIVALYNIDQSRGPMNHRRAIHSYLTVQEGC